MLRVYCSCPGVSATMNLRRSVEKIAVGDIDGDALFALGRQAVHQQRKIDVLALRADPLGIGLERRQLIFEDHLGVVEKPSDERGFTVIDDCRR